tara:strand:+ start:1210 stop:1425 length:216 start_codon:yes stop_codon:yes gene_type:complete
MRNIPLKSFASPIKQTDPPKVKKENIFRGKIVTGKDGNIYHYDKKGKVKKVVNKKEGKVTKYKKGHRYYGH